MSDKTAFRTRDQRGATLVEASISYMLLFMALFAVMEFGLAFKDWLSVSHASREGARAGATFGNDVNADINVLRNVQATMSINGFAGGNQVRIFRANDPSVSTSTLYTFSPGTGTGFLTGFEHLAGTSCDWLPCPEVGRPSYVTPAWSPATRDVTAPTTDRLGVEVRFTHQWITRFWTDTSDFTTQTVFQLEPQLFDPTP
jgi:Flp pilus assembly protein TadG